MKRYDQRIAPVPQARELARDLLAAVRTGKAPATVLDVHAPGEARAARVVRVVEPVAYPTIAERAPAAQPLPIADAYVELHTALVAASEVVRDLAIGEPVDDARWQRLSDVLALAQERAWKVADSHHEWKDERGVVARDVVAAQAVDGAAGLVRYYLCTVLRPVTEVA